MRPLTDRANRCRDLFKVALCVFFLGLTSSPLLAQLNKNPFEEEFSYVNNSRMGERLSVKFPKSPTETTRLTEIALSEERFYNSTLGRYEKRVIGIITGMGLGSTGLKLVLDDSRQLRMFSKSLAAFSQALEYYNSYEEDIRGKTESWMGERWEALAKGRRLGDVYFYPSKKTLEAEFNWDFELERVWLSMGSRVIIDADVVPYISHILDQLDVYQKTFLEYRDTMKSKNQEIDALLGIDPQ